MAAVEYLDVTEPPSLPAGSYEATFTGIEEMDSQFGPRWRWSFRVDILGEEPITVTTFTSPKLNSSTNAWQIVRALLGYDPTGRVDIASLEGRQVSVLLSLKDNGWNKIEQISRLPEPEPDDGADWIESDPQPAAPEDPPLPPEPTTPEEPPPEPELSSEEPPLPPEPPSEDDESSWLG